MDAGKTKLPRSKRRAPERIIGARVDFADRHQAIGGQGRWAKHGQRQKASAQRAMFLAAAVNNLR